jgi:hypothetical protein
MITPETQSLLAVECAVIRLKAKGYLGWDWTVYA